MLWYNLELSCQQEKTFEIEEFLLGFGALSVSFTYQKNNEEFYELESTETPLWDLVKISAIFEKKISSKDIIKILGKTGYSNLIITKFKDRNWIKSYQKEYMPMQFGENLWIIPSWEERSPNARDVILKMDPGMAFGSGTHETTRLCLEYLERSTLTGLIIMDYGCGSGILSIASLLLGASYALATDTDHHALEITKENSIKNNVASRIKIVSVEEIHGLKVDLLISNIFFNTLIKLRDRYSKLLNPGGVIVLSGIMLNQVDPLINYYQRLFKLKRIINKDNWSLVEFELR